MATLPKVRTVSTGHKLIRQAKFDGGTEWMWIEVREWKGRELSGVLVSRPEYVRIVAEGGQVTVSEEGLFDYAIQNDDSIIEGGETNAVLQRRAGATP